MYSELARKARRIVSSIQELEDLPVIDDLTKLRLTLIKEEAVKLAKVAESRAHRYRHPVIERRHVINQVVRRI